MPHRLLISAILLFGALAPINAGPRPTSVQAVASRTPAAQVPDAQTGVPQTIVLPKILVAGERATLAVIDAAGRLVPAVDIDLSSGAKISTDDTGRATFLVPNQTGILTARITETAQDFTTTVLTLPRDPPQGAPPIRESTSAAQLIFPRLIALQERFDLVGAGFSGEAYADSVVLGNLPAMVLAASPVSLVAQANPRTAAGPAQLVAGLAGSHPTSFPVTVISLQVIGPREPPSPGESSVFTVHADGSRERLLLQVRSRTPQVVNLSRGDTEYWSTSGGIANVAKLKLRASTAGSYSLSARLASAGAPGIAIARQQLFAAWQLSNAPWQKALDQLMRQMDLATENPKEADAQHASRFRQRIARLLSNHPPEPAAGLLRLAWQSLGLDAD